VALGVFPALSLIVSLSWPAGVFLIVPLTGREGVGARGGRIVRVLCVPARPVRVAGQFLMRHTVHASPEPASVLPAGEPVTRKRLPPSPGGEPVT
jgi:hypothetical protein